MVTANQSRVLPGAPMTAETLCRCGRPTDGYLCSGCRSQLRNALQQLPGLLAEIEVTTTRQSVTSRGGGTSTKASEEPIPFDIDASDMDWAVRNTVTTWARTIVEERYANLPDVPAGPVCEACFHRSCAQARNLAQAHHGATPPAHFAALCGWLAGHIAWIAQQSWAEQMHDEIVSIRPFANRTVDTREDRYAGPCTAVLLVGDIEMEHAGRLTVHATEKVCGADLRARNGAKQIRCRACDATYDALERADWIIGKSADELATAALIAAAFVDAGLAPSAERLRKRINQWAARSRQWLTTAAGWKPGDKPLIYEAHPIVSPRSNAHGNPLFRIGDIRARLSAEQPTVARDLESA